MSLIGEVTPSVSHLPWGISTILSTAEKFIGTYFSFVSCFDLVSFTGVPAADTYTKGGTANQVGVAVILLQGFQGLFRADIILDV